MCAGRENTCVGSEKRNQVCMPAGNESKVKYEMEQQGFAE